MAINSNPSRIAGIAYLSVDGRSYALVGDMSYSLSTVTRETMIGQDRVHGYKELPFAGFISASLRDAGGLSVADFNGMVNATVTIELANGKVIVGRNMWTVDTQEVKSDDASITVKWEGVSVEEVPAA